MTSIHNRICAFLLAALTFTMLLASCGDAAADTPDTAVVTNPEDVSENTSAAETTDPLADNLPDMNFDGYSFRIATRDMDAEFFYAENLDGEVVNDAVYRANHNVEERFNVDITALTFDLALNTTDNAIGNSILAGDDAFDMVVCHDRTMGQFGLAGMLVNCNTIEWFDYSRPWWQDYTLRSMTIGNVMYLISNSAAYSSLRGAAAVFINKGRMEKFGLEVPYDKVLDGVWTLDMMTDLCKDAYIDVNGDGQRDTTDDFYGFIGQNAAYRVIESFDITVYQHDDEKLLKLCDADDEKIITFIDKYYYLLYETDGGLMLDSESAFRDLFAGDQALMVFDALENSYDTYRYTDVVYAMVPMPKLTETQESYVSGCDDQPFGIPVTNSDLDRTGIIYEAMSAEGYKVIQPAFFEIAMKQKFAMDAESVEMLDIIADNRVLDFGYIHCGNLPMCRFAAYMFREGSGSRDWASFYAKNSASEKLQLESIVAAFVQ